jgi:hypothetical protein
MPRDSITLYVSGRLGGRVLLVHYPGPLMRESGRAGQEVRGAYCLIGKVAPFCRSCDIGTFGCGVGHFAEYRSSP